MTISQLYPFPTVSRFLGAKMLEHSVPAHFAECVAQLLICALEVAARQLTEKWMVKENDPYQVTKPYYHNRSRSIHQHQILPNVLKPIMNQPIFDGLYYPFMVNLGVVYCFTHMNILPHASINSNKTAEACS